MLNWKNEGKIREGNRFFFAMKATALETLSSGEKIKSLTFFGFDASKCSKNCLEVEKF